MNPDLRASRALSFAPDTPINRCAVNSMKSSYIYPRPNSTSFKGEGLLSYTFGPLNQKDVDINYIESEKGHDTFIISKRITRTYYVLSGNGYFTINSEVYPVTTGVLIEIPPKTEYSYSGKMTLLCFSRPRWFPGNEIYVKQNPDVCDYALAGATAKRSWWSLVTQTRILGKSPVLAYLRFNGWLWRRVPAGILNLRLTQSYGRFLHKLVRAQGNREQCFDTFFLRNRPALELIKRVIDRKRTGDTLNVAVLGCSTGAEAYSIVWSILRARPDLRLTLHALDISERAVAFARNGAYSLTSAEMTNTSIFERMTPAEMQDFFDRDGDTMTVKAWIKKGIQWHVGDIAQPETLDLLGQQDLVVANNFLCHMEPSKAEYCLHNISRFVRPEGFLFVSGVDLVVRTKVARELGWTAIQDRLEEIHEGDSSVRDAWPWHYSALEPLNKQRPDYKFRYSACFQLGGSTKLKCTFVGELGK